ncbi:DUF317 domain-containing protein [Streptomyces murinus]|uniref:DUF317 domain-containing protein n=1 Tax=Streptomyces murinus TaxID=33900 RepID=UPI003D67B31E
MLAHGWSHSVRTNGIQELLAPDGLGGVAHRYTISGADLPIWRAWAGAMDEPHWQAAFSSGAPTTLVAALYRLADLHRAGAPRGERHPVLHPRSHLYNASVGAAKAPPSPPTPAHAAAAPAAGRTR